MSARGSIWSLAFYVIMGAVLAGSTFPSPVHGQNFVVARMYNGGSGSGTTGGYRVTAPPSVDVRTWPPACGVALPATGGPRGTLANTVDCDRGYIYNHPNNPVAADLGTNNGNFTFNASGFDYMSTGSLARFPAFWLQNAASEHYGVASIGPGLGVSGTGMITWAATGFDPAQMGTQMFRYDPPGDDGTTSFSRTFPPNAQIPGSIGYTGGMVYTPKPRGPRYGGTLQLAGESLAYIALTFNPGVHTTYSLPVAQTTAGSPIPSVSIGGSTVPGASLVQRRKVFTTQRVRPIVSTPTPGAFPVLGSTVSNMTVYGLREEGPWTTGMIYVSNMSRPGVFPTTTYRTESGTANVSEGIGTIQLVKPYLIRGTAGGRNGRSFTRKLKLELYIPEPASLSLLAAGSATLLLMGHCRRRRIS